MYWQTRNFYISENGRYPSDIEIVKKNPSLPVLDGLELTIQKSNQGIMRLPSPQTTNAIKWSEAYLEPSQTSMIETFCGNS